MDKTYFNIIKKAERKSKTFTAKSDAAEYAGVTAQTLQNRLDSSGGWWEDAAMIITTADHSKSYGKIRTSKPFDQ